MKREGLIELVRLPDLMCGHCRRDYTLEEWERLPEVQIGQDGTTAAEKAQRYAPDLDLDHIIERRCTCGRLLGLDPDKVRPFVGSAEQLRRQNPESKLLRRAFMARVDSDGAWRAVGASFWGALGEELRRWAPTTPFGRMLLLAICILAWAAVELLYERGALGRLWP